MYLRKMVPVIVLMITMAIGFSIPLNADEQTGIKVLALHAQRYQDFERNRILCEVFGEIKNVSDKLLKGVTVSVDFLDESGKSVAEEDIALVLKIYGPKKGRGEARPINPNEVGHFSQDTATCPEKWLEGRIRHKVKTIDW